MSGSVLHTHIYIVMRGESRKLQKLQVVKYVHKNRIGIITEKQLYQGP